MNPSRRLSLFLLMSICCAASAVWPQSQRVLIPAGTGISTDSAVTIISTIGEPLIGVQGGAQLQGIGFWGVSAGGNIVLPPILSVDTESLDFGLGSLGDESVVAIAISNNGGQQLVITGLTANLDQISTGVDTLRIGGGDTSSIDIRLERDHIGRLMGLLQLRSNDPSQPAFEIALAGTTGWARGPRIAVEGPVLLGATSIGDTSIHEVRITNLGDASLSLDAVASGNGFRAVTSGLTLTAGASGQVIITYTPGGEGSALGLLTLTSNDPDRPRVELELQAFGGDMNSPLLLDFIVGPGDQGLRTLGNVVAGLQHTIELVLVDAQPLRGWSAQLTFDPAAVGYVPGSFETSDFLAGLVPLTIELPGQLTVGGTALSDDAGASGPATLGTVRFRILEGFDSQTEIVLTEVVFDRLNMEDEVHTTSSPIVLRSDAIELELPGDFDGSAHVNFDDFFLFIGAFATAEAQFDLNGDGFVNFRDFFLFADFFGLAVLISL